jgi:hypothetical protein
MSLPDRRPATTTGQPTIHQPQPLTGNIELYTERPPIAYVQDPLDPQRSVAIDARLLTPAVYQPRDLTPQPVLDPVAQRMLGAGIGGGALAAGVGWGFAEAAGVFAGMSTGTILWALLLAGAIRTLPALVARRPRIHNETHVHNETRWLGRSTTNVHQR